MEKTFTVTYPKIEAGLTAKTLINFCLDKAFLKEIFDEGSDVFCDKLIAIDKTVAALPFISEYVQKTKVPLVFIPSGEEYKTMESVLEIVKCAVSHNLTRRATFIAIGGGVATDLTAFAASIFKRGVKVHFVPTTLLAMVDASIGGKTGCDCKGVKNIVGTFWPAAELDYYTEFLETLSDKDFRSGLAEAIKTALLFDEQLLETFRTQKSAVMTRDKETMTFIIERCAKAKATVVEADFREAGKRRFLNLGHTFAHALESYFEFSSISHGEAVAWGIVRVARLALNLGVANDEYAKSVELLIKEYGFDTRAKAGVESEDFGKKLLAFMHSDKKNTGRKVTVVLQQKLFSTTVQEVEDEEILKVLK